MVRDPRDRYVALVERRPARWLTLERSTLTWVGSAVRALRNARRYPEAYRAVRYEALVSRSDETMRDVCAFLGEDFDPAMLRMESEPRYDAQRSASQTGSPLSAEYVGCHRDALDHWARRFVGVVAHPEMRAFGYADAPSSVRSGAAAVSAWHTLVDSDSFRWFAKRGPGRPLFRSHAFRRLIVERNRLIADRASRADPYVFACVRTFCFFIGHNKSGTSLLGGLLDANPRIVLSDEADALRYVEAGLEREQLFHILLRSSRTEARKGRVTARRLEPYSYFVPGQSQGLSAHPLVVGDSTSGTSTRRLGQAAGAARSAPRFRNRREGDPGDQEPVRPDRRDGDTERTQHRGRDRALLRGVRDAAAHPAAGARHRPVPRALRVDRGGSRFARCDGHARSSASTRPLDYLTACAAIIHPRPDRFRERIAWSPSQIEAVERRSADFDFLAGYSYAT